ncbi:MAG TPA: UDP-N-acetylmuramate dehydrogenase [Patescibacteria group bacterium]|nr:UDP-N-acetylmuramate dehydrogenase [Patescibacteria group bacterium]
MNLQKNVSLKDYSNYKIGGPASFFLELENLDELKEINLDGYKKVFVMGAGTNILISDNGFDGLVIHNKILGIKHEDIDLRIGSGVLFSDVLKYCIENSLSGLEWAGGLPGTVGGAARGNAGAFGEETKDSVYEVESIDLYTKGKKIRKNIECEFDYRTSIFKENGDRELITEVFLKIKIGDKDEIVKKTQEKIDYRNQRHPMDYPSLGSTFKNVDWKDVPERFKEELKQYIKDDPMPIMPVAKLIFLVGLMGKKAGGAMISDKHPNFIVNVGNAKSSDVLELIELAKNTVKDKYDITLEEEIQYLE